MRSTLRTAVMDAGRPGTRLAEAMVSPVAVPKSHEVGLQGIGTQACAIVWGGREAGEEESGTGGVDVGVLVWPCGVRMRASGHGKDGGPRRQRDRERGTRPRITHDIAIGRLVGLGGLRLWQRERKRGGRRFGVGGNWNLRKAN